MKYVIPTSDSLKESGRSLKIFGKRPDNLYLCFIKNQTT